MKTSTKNKNLLIAFLMAFCSSLGFAQDDFCPGNYFSNGDFEIGTPTNVSNNITLASGWDKIWNGNSEADYYDQFNTATGSIPSPASGDYGSFWIDNRVFPSSATWREGMLNELATTVPLNTGTYSFTFDISCLNGWGSAEIGIYAVHDPTAPGPYVYPGAPASSHVPTNLNLYTASGLPQEIEALGVVPVSDLCDGTRTTETFTFDSNTLGLSGDITHIVVTRSANVMSGGKYVGFDNFCMVREDDQQEPPNNEGAYCCDDENLVVNGNFEAGNTGFTSSYTQTATTFPGEYDVTNTATAFGAAVTDHSFCADPVLYAANDQFMVVNGSTQQASTAVVWEQTLTGLKKGERYKLCANFKNMPQCTFDILPRVFLNAGGTSSGAQTINTIPSDPCDWQTVDITFTATGGPQNIQILLDEGGNGDGNDVAIDDIYVGQLADPNLQITVQHDGTTNQVTGSLNTISNTDDTLHGNECEYNWFVAESAGFPASIVWSTFGYGNAGGSTLPGAIPGPAWDLTTTFPGYVFNNDTLYIVGMYAPECGCYDSDLTYQLTFNTHSAEEPLSQEEQDAIIDAIINGLDLDEVLDTSSASQLGTKTLSLFPNPVQDNFTIKLLNDTFSEVAVVDVNGRTILTRQFNGSNATEYINASSLPSGMYFLQVKGSSNKLHSTKFIKK